MPTREESSRIEYIIFKSFETLTEWVLCMNAGVSESEREESRVEDEIESHDRMLERRVVLDRVLRGTSWARDWHEMRSQSGLADVAAKSGIRAQGLPHSRRREQLSMGTD